ncbi:MAG TPA: hypothetical protein VHF47_13485 [Acidimicrobiales bacterium]|nr:hypothetical protein [Acidimicrobiales bacterium]
MPVLEAAAGATASQLAAYAAYIPEPDEATANHWLREATSP